jgi:hypothetical protein
MATEARLLNDGFAMMPLNIEELSPFCLPQTEDVAPFCKGKKLFHDYFSSVPLASCV